MASPPETSNRIIIATQCKSYLMFVEVDRTGQSKMIVGKRDRFDRMIRSKTTLNRSPWVGEN